MQKEYFRVVTKNENYEYTNKHLTNSRYVIFTHIASINGPTDPKRAFIVIIIY